MRKHFPATLSELEMVKLKLTILVAPSNMTESAVERKTNLPGLDPINEEVVGLRALIAAATDPNFRNCA